MELMKERFAKLLLGEDMSGGGKGVSSALALSNAITNLAGMFRSIFIYILFCIDQKRKKLEINVVDLFVFSVLASFCNACA